MILLSNPNENDFDLCCIFWNSQLNNRTSHSKSEFLEEIADKENSDYLLETCGKAIWVHTICNTSLTFPITFLSKSPKLNHLWNYNLFNGMPSFLKTATFVFYSTFKIEKSRKGKSNCFFSKPREHAEARREHCFLT